MKFSFLSPAYNSAEWITKMLDSIPKNYAYEIVICNDGSTDRTLDILKEYQKKCPQLTIIENDENKGASFSYNRLLSEATGDYVLIIDSDDIYLPTISDVLALVTGEYDIYYYDMLTKIGQHFTVNETNYTEWCGQFKIIRRSLIGSSYFTTRTDRAGDCDFNTALMEKKPTVYFSRVFAYWYNYPRKDSEYDLFRRGLKS